MRGLSCACVLALAGCAQVHGLDEGVKEEVDGMLADAERIVRAATEEFASGSGDMVGAYDKLAGLVEFGPRLAGTEELEEALSWLSYELLDDGGFEVQREDVMVPHWVRGDEWLAVTSPPELTGFVDILGLGTSVGTQAYENEMLDAEVMVVADFDEFERRKSEAQGKVVLFNKECDWEQRPRACYGDTTIYRSRAASTAAPHGALAVLVRSAGWGDEMPHTGTMYYSDGVDKIPAAAINLANATAIAAAAAQGTPVHVNLFMEAHSEEYRESVNVIADWRGWEKPDEIVLVSGHMDSWDVGTGALDDGGGVAVSWQVLWLLKRLNLRPRRTIRFVGWTSEEYGEAPDGSGDPPGGWQYLQNHKDAMDKHSIVMESDSGTFQPWGVAFTGHDDATEIMEYIMTTLLGSTTYGKLYPGGGGVDIDPMMREGVPGAALENDPTYYFYYHHTRGDVLEDTQVPSVMDHCAAMWTVAAYAVANLQEPLPRRNASKRNTAAVVGGILGGVLLLSVAVVFYFKSYKPPETPGDLLESDSEEAQFRPASYDSIGEGAKGL